MNFVETLAELDKLYETKFLFEKYDTQLAKILGNAITQTSNPSGQGDKFVAEKQYLRSELGIKQFGLREKSFIVVHHVDGQHSHNSIDNLAFLAFEDHSKYHALRVSIADDWIQKNLNEGGESSFKYDELDYIARVFQINNYVDACNKLYGEKDSKKYDILPKTKIDEEYLMYIKHLFDIDQGVQKAIYQAAVDDNNIKIIPVRTVQAAMAEANKNKR